MKKVHSMQDAAVAAIVDGERRVGSRSESVRSGEPVPAPLPQPSAADPEVTATGRRRSFKAAYKMRILSEVDACQVPGGVGAILRREGLYSSHLVAWRRERDQGVEERFSRKRGPKPSRSPLAKRVRELERDKARLERRLRKAETIIDVQKKLALLTHEWVQELRLAKAA